MTKTTQDDGRVLCIDGLSGWLYASEDAYRAWHERGDDSGLIAAVEAADEEELSDWCDRNEVMGR